MHGYTDSSDYKFGCVPLVYDFSAGEVLQGYPSGSEDETIAGELPFSSLIKAFPLTPFHFFQLLDYSSQCSETCMVLRIWHFS